MSGRTAKAARRAAGYVKPQKTPTRPYLARGEKASFGLLSSEEYMSRVLAAARYVGAAWPIR